MVHDFHLMSIKYCTLDICFFANRPALVQECYSAPGVSDHDIVVAICQKTINIHGSKVWPGAT